MISNQRDIASVVISLWINDQGAPPWGFHQQAFFTPSLALEPCPGPAKITDQLIVGIGAEAHGFRNLDALRPDPGLLSVKYILQVKGLAHENDLLFHLATS